LNTRHPPGGFREVLAIALPMVIGSSAFTVMQFCDRLFLAWHSDLAIQAAMPAGLLSFSLVCLFTAIAGYSATFVAQYHGAGNETGCVHSAVQGMIFMLLCTPALLLTIPLGSRMFAWFGHAPALVEQEIVYFRWMIYSAIPMGFNWTLSGYFTGRGKVRLATAASIIGCVANVALDYGMIFGRLGFPEMGLRGAAVATCIANALTTAILLAAMLRSRPVRVIGLRRTFVFRRDLMRRLVRFGSPAGVQLLLDNGAFTVFVMMTGRLEPTMLTVANVVFSINNLAFSPLMGFGRAAAVLTGQHRGADNADCARKSGWSSLKLALIYMAIIGAVFVIFPETLLSLFIRDTSLATTSPAFLRTGRHLLYVMTLWGFLDAANIVLMGALKGVGDTKFVMLHLSALAWLFWIPGEIVVFHYDLGILAAWIWMAVYIAVAAFGFACRWRRGKWRRIHVIEFE
jgi:MATE family multidrug resistance protein